ncbi:glycosyl hydrolase family 65 protein [Xylocopilactobacillus apis]|uniref:Maltose phosphorylase n=1 Tax=Xylocopilactobacillus apis TaxID=2932183 RepID=A0AAU9D4X1_9LACO|nr:glycosyl hydrolase family 65 protein [Xylocopilactobacillus apis]BDR57335.1 maltose phosphorylase [Xylocopilactobacillus apis]
MSNLFETDPWHLITGKWDSEKIKDYEQALTVSNSVMEISGAFEENNNKVKLQNIWLSKPAPTAKGYTGYQAEFIDLNKIEILINDQKIDFAADQIEDFVLDLDLHNGLLTRSFVVIRDNIKCHICFKRFLSAARPDLFVNQLEIHNLGTRPLEIEIHSSLDTYYNEESKENDWEILSNNSQGNAGSLVLITRSNDFGLPRFMAGAMAHYMTDLRSAASTEFSNYKAENWFRGTILPDQKTYFEKRVVVVTSLDHASDQEISNNLMTESDEADNLTFDELLAQNTEIWEQRYNQADIIIEGDNALQQSVRVDTFHLLSALGVLKPLSWLDEAFYLPAIIETGHFKEAQDLLNERARELSALIENAKVTGVNGILLPELTFDGFESEPNPDIALFGVHRTAALVFAIAQYLEFTDDEEWLQSTGKELLINCARYWQMRVQYSEYREQYVVLGVSGPDQYEMNVNNNWLTNYSIKWGLQYILQTIPAEFDEGSTKELTNIAEKMYLPEFEVSGSSIKLEDDEFLQKDLSKIAEKLTIFDQPIAKKWSKDQIARSPIIEKPDVFMAFYYDSLNFNQADVKANFDFYQKYLVHDTDISKGLTALTAGLAGEIDQALELLESGSSQFTSFNRYKAAVTRLAVSRGFLGLQVQNEGLVLNPQLPEKLLSYEIPLIYQDRFLRIKVESSNCQILMKNGSDLTLKVNNNQKVLSDGASVDFPL